MDDLFEYMDRYFSGELTAAEKEAFHNRCKSDPAFAEELASYITIKDYVKQQSYLRKQQDLDELEKEEFSTNDTSVHINYGSEVPLPVQEKYSQANGNMRVLNAAGTEIQGKRDGKRTIKVLIRLTVAAAIICFVVLTLTWYNKRSTEEAPLVNNTSPNKKIPDTVAKIIKPDTTKLKDIAIDQGNKKGKDSEKAVIPSIQETINVEDRNALFAGNFKTDAAPVDIPDTLQVAFNYYNNEDYEETIARFDKIQENQGMRNEQTDEEELIDFYTHYYNAQSYLALKNIKKAIPELENAIANSPDDSLKSNAQWYLALAYLKGGNIKKAQKLLNSLSKNNSAGKYKAMSKNLNQQIKAK